MINILELQSSKDCKFFYPIYFMYLVSNQKHLICKKICSFIQMNQNFSEILGKIINIYIYKIWVKLVE